MFGNSVESIDKPILKSCGCGCKKTFLAFDKRGRERFYIKGHNMKGKKPSPLAIQHIIELNKKRIGGKNHFWRGDKVGYQGLHLRIKKRFPKSEHPICMVCLINPSEQLACITEIYNEELKNWSWLCKSCHCKWDNIIFKCLKKKIIVQ